MAEEKFELTFREIFDKVRIEKTNIYMDFFQCRNIMKSRRRNALPETPNSYPDLSNMLENDPKGSIFASIKGRIFYHKMMQNDEEFALIFVNPQKAELDNFDDFHVDGTVAINGFINFWSFKKYNKVS